MSGVTWAGASICPSCKRMVRHKPYGGPHRRHGCRLALLHLTNNKNSTTRAT